LQCIALGESLFDDIFANTQKGDVITEWAPAEGETVVRLPDYKMTLELASLESILNYGEQISIALSFSKKSDDVAAFIWTYNGERFVVTEASDSGFISLPFTYLTIRREAPVVATPVPTPVPVPAPVPTPASALLLVSALGGAGVWVRRRRGARAPQA